MASLQNQTYYAPNNSFFLKNTTDPVFSTITVTTGLAIDGLAGQTWDVIAPLTSTLNTLERTLYPNGIQHNWEQITSSNVVQGYAVGMAGQANVLHEYEHGGVTKAVIQLTSSINNGNGGVVLFSEGFTNLSVRDEGVSMTGNGGSNGSINVFLDDATNAYIQHFPAPATDLVSQIHFNSATSSISLVSATGQSLGVGSGGVGINPGTGIPATLFSGYLDMNDLAMSNVSTINGAPVPIVGAPTQWVNPINGPYPSASTISNAGTLIPLAFFSTTTSNITRVSLNFQSADLPSGGNPTDQAQMSLFSYQLSGPPGPFGPARWLNTWRADQTDDPNGPYTFGTSVDFLSQDTQAGVYINNLTAGGNIQNVTLLSLTTQDMGPPNNVY